MTDVETIKRLVGQLNETWMDGRIDDLAPFFAHDVVMILPGLQGHIVGPDAMVESYRQFVEQATVHRFQEEQMDVRVFGTTAVVTMRFSITYDLGTGPVEESGIEILTLLLRDEKWQIAWRTQASA